MGLKKGFLITIVLFVVIVFSLAILGFVYNTKIVSSAIVKEYIEDVGIDRGLDISSNILADAEIFASFIDSPTNIAFGENATINLTKVIVNDFTSTASIYKVSPIEWIENVHLQFDVECQWTPPQPSRPICIVAENLPSGASFPSASGTGSVTGTFSWQPTFCQAGSYQPIFLCGESCGDSDEVLPVDINVNNANRKPSIQANPVGPISVEIYTPVHIDIQVSDPDTLECSDPANKDPLNVTGFGLPPASSFGNTTTFDYQFDWLPNEFDLGIWDFSFLVYDTKSGNETVNVSVVVNDTPQADVGFEILGFEEVPSIGVGGVGTDVPITFKEQIYNNGPLDEVDVEVWLTVTPPVPCYLGYTIQGDETVIKNGEPQNQPPGETIWISNPTDVLEIHFIEKGVEEGNPKPIDERFLLFCARIPSNPLLLNFTKEVMPIDAEDPQLINNGPTTFRDVIPTTTITEDFDLIVIGPIAAYNGECEDRIRGRERGLQEDNLYDPLWNDNPLSPIDRDHVLYRYYLNRKALTLDIEEIPIGVEKSFFSNNEETDPGWHDYCIKVETLEPDQYFIKATATARIVKDGLPIIVTNEAKSPKPYLTIVREPFVQIVVNSIRNTVSGKLTHSEWRESAANDEKINNLVWEVIGWTPKVGNVVGIANALYSEGPISDMGRVQDTENGRRDFAATVRGEIWRYNWDEDKYIEHIPGEIPNLNFAWVNYFKLEQEAGSNIWRGPFRGDIFGYTNNRNDVFRYSSREPTDLNSPRPLFGHESEIEHAGFVIGGGNDWKKIIHDRFFEITTADTAERRNDAREHLERIYRRTYYESPFIPFFGNRIGRGIDGEPNPMRGQDEVTPGDPNITRIYADYGVDADNNGLLDFLTIVAEVNVTESGNFTVYGLLADHNYTNIIPATNSLFLNTTDTNITLSFEGRSINALKLNDSFRLLFLDILDENLNELNYSLNLSSGIYTTSIYNYLDFEEPNLYLLGNYTEKTIDTDNDNLSNFLEITLNINITKEGVYYTHAWLSNLSGDRTFDNGIVDTLNLVQADVGINSISLTFDGKEIRKNGFDGEYYLNLELFNENASPIGHNYDAYVTLEYNSSSFQLPPIDFIGSIRDRGADYDNDDYLDSMILEVDLNVTKAGDYALYGQLISDNFSSFSSVTNFEYLQTGNNTLVLEFKGSDIFLSGDSGPYSLDVISLYDNFSLVTSLFGIYNTSSYNYTQFEQPGVSFINFSDFGADEDNDSLFDSLVIKVTLEVKESGNYSIFGLLYDNNSEFIESAMVEKTFLKGTRKVNLEFDGLALRRHGIDGQYKLLDINVRDEQGNLVNSLTEAYNTSAYSINIFETFPARFTQIFSDFGEDTNGDSLYDNLVVDVGLNVSEIGVYDIRADLVDSDGTVITSNNNFTLLNSTGLHTTEIRFNGIDVRQNGIDGPYLLQNLFIVFNEQTFVESLDNPYNISAYNFTEFQTPYALFSDNYSEVVFDTNGNGLYDYLIINIGLNVILSGNYTIEGFLDGVNGSQIGFANNESVYLNNGEQTISLIFDGINIYESSINGPYNLAFLQLKNFEDRFIDFRLDVYSTLPYEYTEFEYSIPTVLLISPSNNLITTNTTLDFVCRAENFDNLQNISLYTNISGVWTNDQTWIFGGVEEPDNSTVALWSFDEGSGNNVIDSSGSGNYGRINGANYSSDHTRGAYALSFDGVDDYVNVSDSGSLDSINSQYTIMGWFNIHLFNPSVVNGLVVKNHPSIQRTDGFEFVIYEPDRTVRMYHDALPPIVTSSTSIQIDRWYHLAVTFDGSVARLYINGIEEDNSGASPFINNNHELRIGYSYDGGSRYTNGIFDEVVIYNRSLSSLEIVNSYNSSLNSGTAEFTVRNIPKGRYIWNCLAYDNNSQFSWYGANWSFAIQQGLCGDVNTDGVHDILDVVNMVGVAFRGQTQGDPAWVWDVDSSGAVDVIDVVKIINVAFRGANAETELTCNPTLTTSEGSASIKFGQTTRLSDSYLIPVILNRDVNLAGTQVELSYDSSKLQVLAPWKTTATNNMDLLYKTGSGKQRIGIFKQDGSEQILAGNNEIAMINVKPLTSAPDFSSLKINSVATADADAMKVETLIINTKIVPPKLKSPTLEATSSVQEPTSPKVIVLRK